MTARKVTIDVSFHPVPPGGNPWFDWSVNVDGAHATGDGHSQRQALRRARRTMRRIQRLRSRLALSDTNDIQVFVDAGATE